MIQDIFLRWIVTALFVLSAAECVFAIATARRAWIPILCDTLHFVMSVAMVAMAWTWGAKLPTTGPMVFFLLAAVWFVVIAFAAAGHGIVDGYHALMMIAMSWMYVVMNGNLLPGQRETGHGAHGGMAPHTSMPGMDMPGMDMSDTDTSSGGGYPAWTDAVNWLCAIGFAIAALWWIYRCAAVRRAASAQPWRQVLPEARQAAMAGGVAVVFAAML